MQHWMNKRKKPIRSLANAKLTWGRDAARRQCFAERLRQAQCGLMLLCLCLMVEPVVAQSAADQGVVASEGVSLAEVSSGSLLIAKSGMSPGRFAEAPRLATTFALDVSGPVARVTVDQSFTNDSDDWVEAVYVFPLPDTAAVDHLELVIGERRIVGEIQPREEARRMYRKAAAEGRKAALLSQQRPNLFTTKVSNIAPGEAVNVHIQYQQRVMRDDDRYSLRLPMALTPRYIPGDTDIASADREGSGWTPPVAQVADAQEISPPMAVADTGDYALDLTMELSTALPLTAIVSRYHRIDVKTQAAGSYSVTLADTDNVSDHDFEIEWQLAASATPVVGAFGHNDGRHEFALLQVMPPTDDALGDAPRRELTLVIDTSGSMHGVSIAQAATAVEYAINLLRDIDTFNVVEFNNHHRPLFATPQPATPERRQQAIAWVSRLEANGGTEMRPALEYALTANAPFEGVRQVIFITDGAVGNEEQLFGDIERMIGDARLFTVGIGSAPNGWFMRKAAELGRGRHMMISSVGEVGTRMQALFRQLSQPVLTDIRIDWNATPVEQFPATVRDLYAGEPIDVALRFSNATAAPRTAVLSATLWRNGSPQPWSQSISLDSLANDSQHAVGVMWAHAKIESIADARRRGLHADQARAQIARVAMQHHLVSEATSLVAIDTTPARTQQMLKRRNVASPMPYGQSTQALSLMTATATPAALLRRSGVLALLLGLALLVARRWPHTVAPLSRRAC